MMVYLVNALGTDLYKIGKAVSVERRIAELQTSSPHKLAIVAIVEGVREKTLHEQYKQWRSHGEWFCLPESAVDEIKSMGAPLSRDERVHRSGMVMSDEQRQRLIRNVIGAT